MLSDQIHRALAQDNNRFKVCRMTAKGVRIMHKPGARFEDTISVALNGIGDGGDKSETTGQISRKS